MLTVDATVGGASANSYVTLVEATDLFDARLNSELWLGANQDNQTRALQMAASRLEDENWLGSRVTTTQRLAWPRFDVQKVDGISPGYGWGYYPGGLPFGDFYLSTEIPRQIKDAQCELAIAYLSGYPGTIVKEVSGGGTIVEVEHPAVAGGLPPGVVRLIAGLISGNVLMRS